MKKKRLKHFVMANGGLEIYIFSSIDSLWGFSSKELMDQLRSVPKNSKVTVFINSQGGEVFEGLSIFNILDSWSGDVTTVCTGLAASAASLVFLAGSKRQIYPGAMVMVHNPAFAHASGDGQELQKAADLATRMEGEFVAIYSKKTGQAEDKVQAWMKAETFFDSDEALSYGFATEIVEPPETVARELTLTKLVAKRLPKENGMNEFAKWLKAECETLGLKASELTDEQKTKFRARFDKLQIPPAPPTPAAPPAGDDPITTFRNRMADEQNRISLINDYASRNGSLELNEEYVTTLGTRAKTLRGLASHAVKDGWSFDKFELEARRAALPEIGAATVHVAPSRSEANPQALQAALCMNMDLPLRRQSPNGQEWGVEKWYPEAALEGAKRYRDFGLLQTFDLLFQQVRGYRYHGRLSTDGFLSEMRQVLHQIRAEGNTTWTALNIFDDLANKVLWAAYENQRTTWREWATTTSVNDFKTHNMYRLSLTGGYMKVAADGELQHGGIADGKYTVAANTYGKIVGLSRRDIINDDLGALSGIMTALGVEGAKFLEELAYLTLLNNVTTLFPVGGTYGNYISGASTALGVDGLSAAEKALADQVDMDKAPLMVDAEVLLVGTGLAVTANELFREKSLAGLQTANAKGRPDGNPHIGKFTPVSSPYLNNTALKQRTNILGDTSIGDAIPNQSATQWFLLPKPQNPYGSIITMAFLNGRQRPFVEQGDPAFDVLGLQWRAYHDAGANTGDPKLGVMSKGAA